jgi:hypothetical protein
MKKVNSKLFTKFKDAELSKNASVLVKGGENSNTTGDNTCTAFGQDCTDMKTNYNLDTVVTSQEFDTPQK